MPEPTVTAVINLDIEGPIISRHLYGHFAEHLGRGIYGGFYVGPDSPLPNAGGIRLDIVEALRAIDVPNLRWPGGCFADEYHWTDGIGQKQARPRTVNTHWGGVEETNHFGTHEFMALCELLGAEPYISGNVGSGSVREMSEWVEYLTGAGDGAMVRLRAENGRPEPWRMRFWGLGNEPWGCGGHMRAEQYAALAGQYATYCRDHGDNRLYRIAAGAADADYGWTETLMKQVSSLGGEGKWRDLFQGVSFHYYTMSGSWAAKGNAIEFTAHEYYRTMVKARAVERLIAGHSAVMDSYDPQKRVGLVLDEWGTWWDPQPGTNPGFLHQQNALRDALVASVHFDAFHRHADRLVMANIAQTVNVLQSLVLIDDADRLVRTPTYHAFEMSKRHQDASSLAVHLRGVPVRATDGTGLETLSASASVRDGAALISLTNLDVEQPVTLEVDLRGRTAGAPLARILTGKEPQAHNTGDNPDAVVVQDYDDVHRTPGGLRVTVPPHSFVTVDLPVD